MKHIAFVAILIFFGISTIAAQESQNAFSLKEAQEYALKHNKTLLNANKDLQLADIGKKQALAAGLPQVNATVDYMTNFNYEFAFDIGGGTSEPPQIDYSLLDAGDYQVLSSISQMFGSAGGSTIIMEDQASANIQVTQLIFSGQYWIGLQMAEIGKTLAQKSYSLTELDIKENVKNTYYLILISEEYIKIINATQENLNQVYKHTSNMFKFGMAEQTDADQIKISIHQLENSKKQMERNLQLNYYMFRILLGFDSESEIALTDKLGTFIQAIEKNIYEADSFEIEKNPAFQLIQTQEELGKKSIDMQKWSYAPTLAGYYSYKEKLLTTAFDLSPKNVAGLTLNVPIFSGGEKNAQLSKAKIELDKINTSKDLLREQLTLQEKQLIFELKNTYENYITQKESVEMAKRVYESYNNKYKHGMISSLELTQTYSNYLQAENNYISSVMQLLQSKVKLDKLKNAL